MKRPRCLYCGVVVRALEASTCPGCDDLPALEGAELRRLELREARFLSRRT